MNIGLDISQSVFVGTGVARYVRNLVTSLLNVGKEHHFILFGSTLRRQTELGKFLETLPYRRYAVKRMWLPPMLLSLLWNKFHRISIETFIGRADVVHTSDWTEPPSNLPKVTTIHDLIVYKYPESLPQAIVDNQKLKLTWVKKEAELVIADSESTKRDIVEYLQIPEKKIHVVHLGVDLEFEPQASNAIEILKKRLGIADQFILSVGTREPRKNLARVTEAFNNLGLEGFQLVIVGNPGWGGDIKLSEKILATGFISNQDLAVLYSGASCFVYPSLYEGFGLPILEAMACETLVVTSKRGSLGEVAGSHAIVVEPESVEDIQAGMKRALEMPPQAKSKLLKSAHRYASTFTWEKTARETLNVYNKVLGG